jgi:hypothetical protein
MLIGAIKQKAALILVAAREGRVVLLCKRCQRKYAFQASNPRIREVFAPGG